jgi:hypothetical protein
MIVSLILGIFMVISSAYIFLKERKTGEANRMDPVCRMILIWVIVVSVLYVLLSRYLGFVLATSLATFILIFVNLNEGLTRKNARQFFVALTISEAALLVAYTVGRVVARTMTIAGRKGAIPKFLSSSGMIIGLTAVAAGAVIALEMLIARRIWPSSGVKDVRRNTVMSGTIAVISTEVLYIVFKQLFLVSLIPGLIFW